LDNRLNLANQPSQKYLAALVKQKTPICNRPNNYLRLRDAHFFTAKGVVKREICALSLMAMPIQTPKSKNVAGLNNPMDVATLNALTTILQDLSLRLILTINLKMM